MSPKNFKKENTNKKLRLKEIMCKFNKH
jgi:hypothetical protein